MILADLNNRNKSVTTGQQEALITKCLIHYVVFQDRLVTINRVVLVLVKHQSNNQWVVVNRVLVWVEVDVLYVRHVVRTMRVNVNRAYQAVIKMGRLDILKGIALN